MEALPDKIKRIDVIRIEYGKRKLCECRNPHYEIDYTNRFVTCEDCGAVVEPFEALYEMALHYRRLEEQISALLEQRKIIENYKPHLVVMKELEKRYRENNYSMVPVCPICREAFDLKDIISWRHRKFLKPGQPEEGTTMKFLNDKYAKVFSHKGLDICTLKSACPANGDKLGYVIDDERFAGQEFNRLDDAVRAVDLLS